MPYKELFQKYITGNNSIKLPVSIFDSPLGVLIGIADDDHLQLLSFADSKNFEKKLKALHHDLSCSFVEDENKVLQILQKELVAYFDGTLKNFTVPLKFRGSEFQKEVWKRLQDMQYGSTQSYGALAMAMGRAGSARAVGAACGANAHVLVIPCHRLVATASKGGFSCGVDRKDWLILHEKKHAA